MGRATPVDALPDPLRGVAYDSKTLADFLATIHGPCRPGRELLRRNRHQQRRLRGHKNVKALVYVDAFIPAKGEHRLRADHRRSPDPASPLAPATAFNFVSYPGERRRGEPRRLPQGRRGTATYAGFAACLANGVPAGPRPTLLAAARRAHSSRRADRKPSGPPRLEDDPVLGRDRHR